MRKTVKESGHCWMIFCLSYGSTIAQVMHREIKKFNIQKEFKAHTNGLKEINGQLTVNMRSVLKYFFNHSESLYICQKVVEQIEKRCFYKNSSSEKTIKDIYSAIVKTVYRNSSIEKHILAN
jgi:DNA-binding ferritin-like protein (Dps family)